MSGLNLGLRFFLELAGIAAVAYWGYETAEGGFRWVLAVAAPAVLIAAWALVIAPGAQNPIPQHVRVLLGSGLLLVAAALLAVAGQPVAATAFAILIVVNTALLFALRG